MNGVVNGFVVIGIVIVAGYFLARSGVLGPAAVEVLSRLAFFVASPALLFVTLAHADVRAVFSEPLIVTAAFRPEWLAAVAAEPGVGQAGTIAEALTRFS